jgi:nucleoside 2-deoxyribosyltransferase
MFYVAHRLFAAHDRELGALTAAALADRTDLDSVFLPFCDTDEEQLQADVKGKRLFDLDCERLPGLDGMLAILHGPSLDDGVCMEIGYAAALNIPIIVLTTDFQTYGHHQAGPQLAFADPLIEAVVDDIVRTNRLDPPDDDITNRLEAYRRRNRGQVHRGINHAVDLLLHRAHPPRRPDAPPPQAGHVFAEPSPYQPGPGWHAHRDALAATATHLHEPQRFTAHDPVDAARGDWTRALHCESMHLDVSGPETPPGAAMFIGAAIALGRPATAYTPRTSWTFADGREPNWRNLMIQYGVSALVSETDQSALPTPA